jgi:hypothetical protein
MKQFSILFVVAFSVINTFAAKPLYLYTTISINGVVEPKVLKQWGIESSGLIISPNPKTGDALLKFNAEKAGQATILVLNAAGNTVLKEQVNIAAGKNNINISIFKTLTDGNYMVSVHTDNSTYSSPFLLWK